MVFNIKNIVFKTVSKLLTKMKTGLAKLNFSVVFKYLSGFILEVSAFPVRIKNFITFS